MSLPFFIARRYLFSKRKKNFINVISIIAILEVSLITMAFIVILSTFNGLEELLTSLNSTFDPEIKVEAVKGKSFVLDENLTQKIKSVQGVEFVTEVIEDYAYARYRDANQLVTLKGVSTNFLDQHRLDKAIIAGELLLQKNTINYAIVGSGVWHALSINVSDKMYPLQVFYVKDVRSGNLDPSQLYARKTILPTAVFSIVQNLDESYVIVPLDFAQDLLNYGNKRTALEIKTRSGFDPNHVELELQAVLGPEFLVLNHLEQHKDLYRLLKTEKLAFFLAWSLLLTIGAITIFLSLMMLALDKKKDISILSAMGAGSPLIKKIYLTEGVLIAAIGTVLGLALGALLCFLQSEFGLLSMGMETSVTEGYPIKMVFSDFFYVMLMMFFITLFISFRPAVVASRFVSVENL